MDSVAALREILVSALGTGSAPDGEQALFDQLVVAKPRLLNVFDFGPRNPQEQRQLDSGKIELDGRSFAVNKDFARQVSFLAAQLNCSERFLTSVTHSVLADNPTIGEVDIVEQAVLAYHKLRRDLAECLRFLFEAADAAEKGYAKPLLVRLKDFVKRQFLGSGPQASLAYRIFSEISSLNGVIASARVAVTNAVSNTTVPTTPGAAGNLGQAILQARLESLIAERRTLAIALYFLARSGYFQPSEHLLLLEWLQKNPRNDMTFYVLSTLCAALDLSHSAPGTANATQRMVITRDTKTVSAIRKLLSPTTEWTDGALKATVMLKWMLFLTEARVRDYFLEKMEGFRNEDLEMQVFNAVQSDALTFMLSAVTLLNANQSGAAQLLASKVSPSSTVDLSQLKGSLTEEFKEQFLHEFELIIRSLLTHAPAELRKIKHKQEDQFRPRSDRIRTSTRADGTTTELPPPRNDIATLFLLIGQLYSALPTDKAIQFWGGVPETETPAYYEMAEAEFGKLPSFLRWAVEVREPELVISVFYMLAGLSTGVACAECAYNFMATGTLDVIHGAGANVGRYESSAAFTWASIFSELDGWASLGNAQPRGGAPANGTNHGALGAPAAPANTGMPPPQLPIAQSDVLLGLAFLRLLTIIATHSTQARIAVASHPQYRAISCFIALIPLGVPLELKGALFEALAAFCLPGAGAAGVDVCRAVWSQMERLEVISVRGGAGAKGVELELEEVESVYRVYPATIPFLTLLSTLIHTPKRVPLKARVAEPAPLNTVPEGLGVPYRAPGIAPYVAFAVDGVLARLARRELEFAVAEDKWRMCDAAMCFIERCLAAFDLESLPELAEAYALKGPEVLAPLLQHPGFDVLSRILGETPLRTTLIAYVVEGAEELGRQPGNVVFGSVVLRALRILERVLEIQDLFLDHLVPVLSEFDSAVMTSIRVSQSFLSRIDQGLSLDHRSIPAIGSYINQRLYPELMFLSTRILAALSQSPSFENIALLIERNSESAESDGIVDGFVRALASDSFDDVAEAEEWADLWTGAGAPDADAGSDQPLFAQVIRLAVLDLLLRGTKTHSKASALAFLLLFGKTTPDTQIQDPHALGAREYCLHVALFLLNIGVPRLAGKGKEKEERRRRAGAGASSSASQTAPLFDTQPVLAERLYKLVHQLCEHPRTSSAMMLYLRTREDFFARHLAAMSMHVPIDPRAPAIEVLYGDGSRVSTTCATMKSFLQLRSWMLDLVSLELHVLSGKNQNQRMKELLDLLFGTTEYYEGDGVNGVEDWEHNAFRSFNDVGQSRIRAIELFQSLAFEWFDSVEVTPVELQYYKSLNLQACVRPDADGCPVVDRAALFELLSTARRTLLRNGSLTSPHHTLQLDSETQYILTSCVAENNRRSIAFSLGVASASWTRLLSVVLTKCFTKIAADRRENVLFDLLVVVPPRVAEPTLGEAEAEELAGLVLVLVTKLREERRQEAMMGLMAEDAPAGSAMPQERMLALLRNMLDTILAKHRGDRVRGNIYAALTSFLHLVASPPSTLTATDDLSASTSFSSSTSEASFAGMSASNDDLVLSHRRTHTKAAPLQLACSAVIKQSADRLVQTISKDAIDGAEVWKTIAFTLLEFLARLSVFDSSNKSHQQSSHSHYLLASLERYGLLLNVVHSLRESDSVLQDVLRNDPSNDLDPDDLNALYVYETKMAFLGRLAQTRVGAERLLECRVLPILAQADFLDAQPEVDDAALMDQDGFLPSALGRYHQLLVPALQLVEALYASLGSRHTAASKQVLDFLYSHRDSFVIMLKQDIAPVKLATVEELDLIVSLCALIVPSVPQTDFFATNTGFGSLHNAILSLSSKALGSDKWESLIQPSDETEYREAEVLAYGYGVSGSKFAMKARRAAFHLRKSVLSYLSAASNFSEAELTVVLAPAISRNDERTSVPLPTLKNLIATLKTFSNDIQGAIQEIAGINVELEYPERVRIDNIEQLVGPLEVEAALRLDSGYRRALVVRTLQHTIVVKRDLIHSLLVPFEMLLHLLWTHLIHYSSEQASPTGAESFRSSLSHSLSRSHATHPQAPNQPYSKSSALLRYLTVTDAQLFRTEAASAIRTVTEKLEKIQLSEDFAGRTWRANQSYLELMCRCLQEVVRLDHDGRAQSNDPE